MSESNSMKTTTTNKPTGRRFRTIAWGNLKTGETRWGLQASPDKPGGKWACCASGGKPLLFKTRQEAQAEIRRQHRKEAP